ncbi:MAG TPA: hypothetical protein VNT79_18090 [Phycisphaerae bacterium]|nr:hypothetical protein [Phycisphaerae bacterium]
MSLWLGGVAISATHGIGARVPPAMAQARPPAIETSPVKRLRAKILAQIQAGHIDAALAAAQQSLADNPGDREVLREFVLLHRSLARQLVTEERYALADTVLDALLRADSEDAAALILRRRIRQSRASVRRRIAQAREWIELEWFEPAGVAFRQAIALRPEHRKTWVTAYRSASIGAGDDNYITKNFHEAFYHYDAALALGDELGIPPAASLMDRWLQCLTHAMTRDAARTAYPPEYWRLALGRAAAIAVDRHDGSLVSMLKGLAYENLEDPARARKEYARFLNHPGGEVVELRDLHGRAVRALRSRYDTALCDRRKGFWLHSEKSDPGSLASPRFRIHHRNSDAAALLARAADFHFDRIATALALETGRIPWLVACDVHLHRDADAFRRVTRQGRAVQAQSIINSRGGVLESHAIHLFQTDPMLLSASLPHELAHLMIAAATEYKPLPGALREGMAIAIEPRCRRRQFVRLFRELSAPRDLGRLLQLADAHPLEPAFYSEAFRLVSVLQTHKGLGGLLRLAGTDCAPGTLVQPFGFESTAALESAYLAVEQRVKSGR